MDSAVPGSMALYAVPAAIASNGRILSPFSYITENVKTKIQILS